MFAKLFSSGSGKPRRRDLFDDDGHETVNNPVQIVSLLEDLISSHALLTVTPPGSDTGSISAILKISAEKDLFLLDGVQPLADHENLLQAGRFSATARLNGIRVNFDARIDSVGQDDGITFYRVAIPQSVIYEQKRKYFRAASPMDEVINVYFTTVDDVHLEGELRDLSVGGISALIDPTRYYRLDRGMVLPVCSINMADDKRIVTSVEVRYASSPQVGKRTSIGARFIDLDRKTRRDVQNMVGKLDRMSTKNRQRQDL